MGIRGASARFGKSTPREPWSDSGTEYCSGALSIAAAETRRDRLASDLQPKVTDIPEMDSTEVSASHGSLPCDEGNMGITLKDLTSR